MEHRQSKSKPMIVAPGDGRVYDAGRIKAVFKADLGETAERFSVSEWWLEPRTLGPSVHQHGEDHVYYVIAGTLSVCLDGAWSPAAQGSYVIIPGGTPHSFENREDVPAGFITFNTPGGFEERLPDIAAALGAEDLRM